MPPSLEGYHNRAIWFGFGFHHGSIFYTLISPNSIFIVAFPSLICRPHRQIYLVDCSMPCSCNWPDMPKHMPVYPPHTRLASMWEYILPPYLIFEYNTLVQIVLIVVSFWEYSLSIVV